MNDERISYIEAWKLNGRAWGIWRKLCPGMFWASSLSAVISALSPYVAIWLSARIIQELTGEQNPQMLFRWVAAQLISGAGLALLGGILTRWSKYESDRARQMGERVFMEKMMGLDYGDMDRQEVFDLYAQIRQNQQWSNWGIAKSRFLFEKMVKSAVQIFGGIGLSVSLFTVKVAEGGAVALLNHPLCGPVMIAFLLLAALAVPACSNRGNRYWSAYGSQARLGNRYITFYGYMSEDRRRAADIRMYRQQERVCGIYMDQAGQYGPDSAIGMAARGPMGFWMALSKGLSVMLVAMVYVFVCLKAWGGAFGAGLVTQYVGAITNLFLGISGLLEHLGTMEANGSFLKDCYEFLDIPNPMYQGSLTTEKRSDRQYEVEFRDVSFRYPGSDQWALRHVNMKFRVGSRLAVVGRNGSGKTTFIKLLCRLYDPTEGTILLNGIDIRKYRYEDYIALFSVVFQDFRLLALPLGENIAGGVDYEEAQVSKCLRDAGCSDKNSAFPKGLDTYLYKELDKDGVDVSGGEAQKIAIARALYKAAPFIILDEPTAALDPMAEAEIYEKFNDIAGDKTAVYISHRLASCRFCDEIAVFSEGQVIQQGTHEQLVADKNGDYYELWNAQAQYYAEKMQ